MFSFKRPKKLEDFKIEVAWAAGFWEGEGYIKAHSHYKESKPYGIYISACQADKEPLLRLQKTFGGHLTGPYGPYNNVSKKVRYEWRITKLNEAIKFIQIIWPHLSEFRRRQILKVIKKVDKDVPLQTPKKSNKRFN